MATVNTSPAWTFDADEHLYREGQIICPSVTQVLSSVGLSDYSRINPETLERKRDIGDVVHAATEIIDKNQELDWDTVAPEAVGYVVAWEKAAKELQFTPKLVEHQGIGLVNGMKVGFKIDAAGVLSGGLPIIVERKCTSGEEVSWRYQLAAYSELLGKPEGAPVWVRLAVQLKPDGTYKTFKYDDPRDLAVFRWALALTWEKINRKLDWRR